MGIFRIRGVLNDAESSATFGQPLKVTAALEAETGVPDDGQPDVIPFWLCPTHDKVLDFRAPETGDHDPIKVKVIEIRIISVEGSLTKVDIVFAVEPEYVSKFFSVYSKQPQTVSSPFGRMPMDVFFERPKV